MSSWHYYYRSHLQVVELTGIILTLSIEVLVGVILTQPLKATNGEKTAQAGFYGVIVNRKLYCLTEPTHSGVSASAERPKDADEETRGQRTRGQRDQVCS